MDEVVMTETIESNNYSSRKGKTYSFLGTTPYQWIAAKIIGYSFVNGVGEVPIYEIPEGYVHAVTSYSVGSVKFKKLEEAQKAYRSTNIRISNSLCELCGHPINQIHYIVNHVKKLYLHVGSECVHNKYGKIVKKTVKHFKDDELRQKFRDFREKIIPVLNTKLDIYDNTCEEYKAYVLRTHRLKWWAWELREKIKNTDEMKTGSTKLKNLIKKTELSIELNK